MDSTRVYTKRILDDLKVASAFFADVEFVWKDQKIPTSSLILAALSGMMSTALKDLVYENIDDRIQIIVPDSEIDFGLVSSFGLLISVFLIRFVLIGNSVPVLESSPITAPPTFPDPIVLGQLETKHNFMAHIP